MTDEYDNLDDGPDPLPPESSAVKQTARWNVQQDAFEDGEMRRLSAARAAARRDGVMVADHWGQMKILARIR